MNQILVFFVKAGVILVISISTMFYWGLDFDIRLRFLLKIRATCIAIRNVNLAIIKAIEKKLCRNLLLCCQLKKYLYSHTIR